MWGLIQSKYIIVFYWNSGLGFVLGISPICNLKYINICFIKKLYPEYVII